MKLVHTATGVEIKVGDIVHTFRGEKVVVVSLRPPHKNSSEGHVTVSPVGADFGSNTKLEFYAGVINAHYENPNDKRFWFIFHDVQGMEILRASEYAETRFEATQKLMKGTFKTEDKARFRQMFIHEE